MNNSKLCSGDGVTHTDRTSPLNAVDWDDITRLLDNPQSVPKEDATWLIPSTLLSRNSEAQKAKGEYRLLWVDIDDAPPQLSEVADIIADVIDGCIYEPTQPNQRQKGRRNLGGLYP